MSALEIERKFLVPTEDFLSQAILAEEINQGYLHEGLPTVRVRTRGEKAFLTIKGPSDPSGLVRAEYEYPIPVADAEGLLALCTAGRLEKTRYLVPFAGYTWEVDVFHGRHEGLRLAEIELSNPEECPPLPPWVGEEVTGDPRYYNSTLASAKQF